MLRTPSARAEKIVIQATCSPVLVSPVMPFESMLAVVIDAVVGLHSIEVERVATQWTSARIARLKPLEQTA